MGDGSGDSQAPWQEFFGLHYAGQSILDVGAGRGLSKDRLAAGGNRVTTIEIERSRMLDVDRIADVRDVTGKWDVVTAFDVIEHVPDARAFLDRLIDRARRYVVITTPSYRLYPQPWHFSPAEVAAWAADHKACWFARYKAGDIDRIEEIDQARHLSDPAIYAHGLELHVA